MTGSKNDSADTEGTCGPFHHVLLRSCHHAGLYRKRPPHGAVRQQAETIPCRLLFILDLRRLFVRQVSLPGIPGRRNSVRSFGNGGRHIVVEKNHLWYNNLTALAKSEILTPERTLNRAFRFCFQRIRRGIMSSHGDWRAKGEDRA